MPTDIYPAPESPLDHEPEIVELNKPTVAQDDAWAEGAEQERLRKYAEAEATEQLDRLREEQLLRDKIELPKSSREPNRRHVREGFYWQQADTRR